VEIRVYIKVRVIVGLAKNVKGNRENNEHRGAEKGWKKMEWRIEEKDQKRRRLEEKDQKRRMVEEKDQKRRRVEEKDQKSRRVEEKDQKSKRVEEKD
jgi:hypothetical protein